jgi:hypothetical protein
MYPSEAKALQPRFLLTCTSCRVVKIGPSDGLGTFGLPNVTQETLVTSGHLENGPDIG